MAVTQSRRAFLRTGLLVSASALLAACAPAAPPAAPSKPAEPAKPAESKPAAAAAPTAAPAAKTGGPTGTVIKEIGRDYLAYPDVKGTIQFSNCWAAARIKLVEDIWIKPFNAIYPGIKIENDVGDCPPLLQKQTTAVASSAPPNMMMIKSDGLPFFAEQKAILPLDDLMARDKVDPAWFYPAELNTRKWNGKVYGLPNVTAGAFHLLFYNTKLMEKIGTDPNKPPKTWQDLDAMVEPAKKAGLLVMDPAHVSSGMTVHEVLTYMNGGKYWTDDLKKITWNEPPGVEAAEWLLQFIKAQGGKYENVASGADRKNVMQPQDWAPEKFVTSINGSWFFFQLKSSAPHIQYGVTTFPTNAKNPSSKLATPADGGWAFSIAALGKDQEAVWEFIKYTTTSAHGACRFVKEQNRPSPVASCNEDPELKAGNPWWHVVEADLKANVAIPVASIHPKMVNLFFEMEDAILFEKMPPKEALDKYAADAQKMLDEWNAQQK